MRTPLAALLAVSLVVAACSGAMGLDTRDGPPAGDRDEAWRTSVLVDVLSGDEFRIDDLRDRVVAIETMAIWCGNCRVQQLEAQAALDMVGSDDVVYISLDIDANEPAEDLADYARRHGFDWRFVVASPDVARSLAASFGDQILSPPATPLVLIGPDGRIAGKHVGIIGAGNLASLLEEYMP